MKSLFTNLQYSSPRLDVQTEMIIITMLRRRRQSDISPALEVIGVLLMIHKEWKKCWVWHWDKRGKEIVESSNCSHYTQLYWSLDLLRDSTYSLVISHQNVPITSILVIVHWVHERILMSSFRWLAGIWKTSFELPSLSSKWMINPSYLWDVYYPDYFWCPWRTEWLMITWKTEITYLIRINVTVYNACVIRSRH